MILMTQGRVGFSYIVLYIFLLAEKKKIAGRQTAASLEQCHFSPGNVSVLIL